MFFFSRYEKAPDEPLLRWLVENEQLIQQGAGSYKGQRVTAESKVTRYGTVISCIFMTVRMHTPFLLAESEGVGLAALRASVVTALFGWWAPFGMGYTPVTLVQNLSGGEKTTVAQVLYDLHHPEEAARKANAPKPTMLYAMLAIFVGGLLIAAVMLVMYKLDRSGAVESGGSSPTQKDSERHLRSPSTDPELALYMQRMQTKIKRVWVTPRGGGSKTVVVLFTIHPDGQISNLKVAQSCGDRSRDWDAIEAVNRAAPFDPSPTGKDADVQFTFDL